MVVKVNRIRCPQCNSNQTYIRLTTQELVCRSCSHIEKMEEIKNET